MKQSFILGNYTYLQVPNIEVYCKSHVLKSWEWVDGCGVGWGGGGVLD